MISSLKIIACLFALFIGTETIAQPTFTGVPGYINLNYDSSYEISETRFQHELVSATITLKSSEKTMATFHRWNDSAFAFTQYDAAGKKSNEGLLLLDKTLFNSITYIIPDVVSDPSGEKGIMKDTKLQEYFYQKHGNWTYYMGNRYWESAYNFGLKQGLWLHFSNRPGHNPFPLADSACVYKNGNLDTFNYIHLGKDGLARLLQGKWNINWLRSGRFILNCNKDDNNLTPRFEFIDGENYREVSDDRSLPGKWYIDNNNLILKSGKGTKIYKIVTLNEKQLVLTSYPD